MNIALLHYSSPPIVGGVESVLAHHARLMTKAGHRVTVITGRGEIFDEHIPVQVFPLLDSRHPLVRETKIFLDQGQYPSGFNSLRDQIETEITSALKDFDILIAHNVASLHKNLALTAALNAAYQNPSFPRLILWHHDLAWTTPRYRSEMHPGYPWNLLRSNWEGARHVVVSAQRCRELTRLIGIPSKSIQIVPNGVDLQSFFKLEAKTIELVDQLNLLEAMPLFLLPARLTPRKNIELALQIMAELKTEYPNAMLIVTGPEGPHNPSNAAYKEKLLSLRDNLKLRGSVHFMAEVAEGFLPDSVIADFFRLADALLFPSSEEGFGIPMIEAGFSSIPVFCSDIPVLRELGGEDVSYFDLNMDPGTIAKQISKRLYHETTSRWALRAKHEYAWGSIYNLYIEPLLKEAM